MTTIDLFNSVGIADRPATSAAKVMIRTSSIINTVPCDAHVSVLVAVSLSQLQRTAAIISGDYEIAAIACKIINKPL